MGPAAPDSQRKESALQPTTPPAAARLDYIDNLRWTVIFLVVAVHSGCTYSGMGSWYHMEPTTLSLAARFFFMLFLTFCQGFFMGFLFFVSALFVPGSYDRKGPAKFLRDRFIRLGIPSLLYMLVVHPLTGQLLLDWWGNDFAHGYLRFITHLRFLSASGPMWFAVALFFFDVAYVCWKQFRPGAASPAAIQPKWRHIWITGAVIAVLAFLIRTVQPIGTSVLNMQLCFFAQYVILFALGIVVRRRRWLEQLTDKMAFTALGLGTLGGLAAWIAMAAILHAIPNSFHLLDGGWNLPAAIFALWESFYCVTICTGLLGLYRHFYNRRGPVEAYLSDNAFGVYFIHPPVLIGITLLMTSWVWPPVAKFAFAAAAAILASYAVTSLVLRRTPLLRRIL
jgi:fucose 4-O-acetylase-like acetyltransferase